MKNCPHCETDLTASESTETCPACFGSLVDVGVDVGATVAGEFSGISADSLFDEMERSEEQPSDHVTSDADSEPPSDETVVGHKDSDTFADGIPTGETVIAPQNSPLSPTVIKPVADPNATFIPPSDPDATFLPGADDDVDPALQQTGIGNFADGWSEAFAQPGVTDDTSLKVPISQKADSETTLLIQSRTMSSPDDRGTTAGPADYDLIDMLGKGGMGVVYAARQASIDRTVAVKMLKSGTADSSDARNKFLSEACVTGDLEHPNIVPIYDVGRDASGALFYAMKRVQGTPWKDVLAEKSLDENLQILMRVADAVAFGHSKGILHRDLKPENTMLGGFGEVLVMDWGLAMPIDLNRRFGGIQQVPDLGGTPAYMAPEMIIGPLTEIGVHSDVYLLGAILYEIVTGRRPHAATPEMNCIHAAAHNIIQPTEKKGELVNIAIKAMKTDPRLRYKSVVQFQAAVRQYESHSESIHLSNLATNRLDVASETQAYDDYNQALFGFQQALELWDGNDTARTQLAETRYAYATTAKVRGDYDLATGLLNVSLPNHSTLHTEITAAAKQRDLRQQRAKTYQRVGLGLAGLLFVVISGAAVWINSARNEAELQKQAAIEQKGVAEENRQLAETARDQVIEEKAEVERQKTEVDAQRMEAERQEGIAKDKAEEARQQKMEAERQQGLAMVARDDAVAQKERAEIEEKRATEQKLLAEQRQREAVAARKAEAYEAYVARIGAAAARIEENAHDQARELLQQCQPQNPGDTDYRNWEWQRLSYLCQRASSTFTTSDPVECLATAWNPDGTLKAFAAGTRAGAVEIRHADGSLVCNIKTSGSSVNAVAFSPDATQLLTGSNKHSESLQLFDSSTGELINTMQTDAPTTSAEFSNDGQFLLSAAEDGTVTIRDAVNGLALSTLHGHRGAVHQARFMPGIAATRIVTVGEDGAAIVWTDATGQWNDKQAVQQSPPFTEHNGAIFAVAIAADGNTIATAGHDQRVLLWNVSDVQEFDFDAATQGESATPTPYSSLDGHTAAVRSLAFSDDGKTLISAGHDNAIRVWDVAQRRIGFQPVRSAAKNSATTNSVAKETGWKPILRKTLRGHGQWIRACRISPDGTTVISAGYDETVRTWNIATYQEIAVLKTLNGHDDAVLDAQFSSAGDRIVTASRDRTIRTWNADTAEPLLQFREGHSFLASNAAFTADGATLATAAVDGTVRLWDAQSGSQQHVLTDTGRGAVVAFSSDGTFVVTGGPGESTDGTETRTWNARIWDVSTGKLLHELPGHAGQISAVAFAPNSTTVFCGDTTGLGILWNADTGERIRVLKWHTARIIAARFTTDGSLITAAAERSVARWNVSAGTVDETKLLLHSDVLQAVDVDSTGRFVATVCRDNSVRIWDWTTGKVVYLLHDANENSTTDDTSFTSIAWSPNRQLIAVADSGRRIVRLYNAETGDEIFYRQTNDRRGPFLELPRNQQLNSVQFSPAGNDVLTVGGDRVTLWENDESRAPFRRLKTNFSPHGVIASAAYSPDQQHIISGSWDGTAVIWNAQTGKSIRKLTGAHRGPVNSAAFSPHSDPTLALTTSDDGTAVLWDAATGKFLRRFSGHTGKVVHGAFSPDGQMIVTTSSDGTARIWKVTDTTAPLHELHGHTATVVRATFSHDGLLLATAGADNTAMLWDVPTGKLIRKLTGHTAAVNDVTFTADGQRLITASDDFHCKVWDTATGKELLTLKGHTRKVSSVTLSPTTSTLLTSSHDGTAIEWPTSTPEAQLPVSIPASGDR